MIHNHDKEEQDAIKELKAMSREELQKVDHEVLKWACCVKGCKRYTRVWDFGIQPEIYFTNRREFISIYTTYFLCGTHYKFHTRLQKNFTVDVIQRKLLDHSKITNPFIL